MAIPTQWNPFAPPAAGIQVPDWVFSAKAPYDLVKDQREAEIQQQVLQEQQMQNALNSAKVQELLKDQAISKAITGDLQRQGGEVVDIKGIIDSGINQSLAEGNLASTMKFLNAKQDLHKQETEAKKAEQVQRRNEKNDLYGNLSKFLETPNVAAYFSQQNGLPFSVSDFTKTRKGESEDSQLYKSLLVAQTLNNLGGNEAATRFLAGKGIDVAVTKRPPPRVETVKDSQGNTFQVDVTDPEVRAKLDSGSLIYEKNQNPFSQILENIMSPNGNPSVSKASSDFSSFAIPTTATTTTTIPAKGTRRVIPDGAILRSKITETGRVMEKGGHSYFVPKGETTGRLIIDD